MNEYPGVVAAERDFNKGRDIIKSKVFEFNVRNKTRKIFKERTEKFSI